MKDDNITYQDSNLTIIADRQTTLNKNISGSNFDLDDLYELVNEKYHNSINWDEAPPNTKAYAINCAGYASWYNTDELECCDETGNWELYKWADMHEDDFEFRPAPRFNFYSNSKWTSSLVKRYKANNVKITVIVEKVDEE